MPFKSSFLNDLFNCISNVHWLFWSISHIPLSYPSIHSSVFSLILHIKDILVVKIKLAEWFHLYMCNLSGTLCSQTGHCDSWDKTIISLLNYYQYLHVFSFMSRAFAILQAFNNYDFVYHSHEECFVRKAMTVYCESIIWTWHRMVTPSLFVQCKYVILVCCTCTVHTWPYELRCQIVWTSLEAYTHGMYFLCMFFYSLCHWGWINNILQNILFYLQMVVTLSHSQTYKWCYKNTSLVLV